MTVANDELCRIIRLAIPSLLSTFSFFGISLTELSIAGHIGVHQLAAVAFSQMTMDFSILVFMQGFNAGLNALCSQAFGAKNFPLLVRYVQITSVALTVMCVPVALLWWHIGPLLAFFGVHPEVVQYAVVYSRISILWLWPRSMFQVLAIFYQTQLINVPAAIANVLSVALNAFVTVGLTFGRFGMPEWGFIGCPIGTSVSLTFRLIVFAIVMRSKSHDFGCQCEWNLHDLPHAVTDRHTLRTLFAVGIPLMTGQLFENAQFQVMSILAALIGEVQLASHNSMMELFFFATSPIYSVVNASVTLIGGHLGAGNHIFARKNAQVTALCLAVLIAINMVALEVFAPQIGRIFSKDPAVVTQLANVSGLAAIAYFVLFFFYYALAVLQAQARSVPVMVAFTCGAWCVGVPMAYLLSLQFHFALRGVWIGMIAGYVVTSAISFYYAFVTSNWPLEAFKAMERSKTRRLQQTEADPLLSSFP